MGYPLYRGPAHWVHKPSTPQKGPCFPGQERLAVMRASCMYATTCITTTAVHRTLQWVCAAIVQELKKDRGNNSHAKHIKVHISYTIPIEQLGSSLAAQCISSPSFSWQAEDR